MIEVNTLWVGCRLSTLEVLAAASHLKQGHRYSLWAYGAVDNVPDGVAVEDANEILPESEVFTYQRGEGAGSVSAFSNLFRYKLLAERGGWWVDADVVALKPFEFDADLLFASERTRGGFSTPTTCVIRVPDGPNGVARDCYEQCRHFRETCLSKLDWGSLGPALLSRVVFGRCLGEYAAGPSAFCPVNWFESEYDPPVHRPVDLSGSYAVHLWHEMWRRRGLDKDGSYDPLCLYEKLKHAFLRPATPD